MHSIRQYVDTDAAKTGAAFGAAGPLMGQILAPIGQGVVSAGRAAKDYIPGIDKIFQPRILGLLRRHGAGMSLE